MEADGFIVQACVALGWKLLQSFVELEVINGLSMNHKFSNFCGLIFCTSSLIALSTDDCLN